MRMQDSLAILIAQLTGFTGGFRVDPSKPDGQPRRALGTELAANMFGFASSTSMADGLAAAVVTEKSRKEIIAHVRS